MASSGTGPTPTRPWWISSRIGHYDPEDFWEPIKRPRGESFILEADRFYILVSQERIRVPPGMRRRWWCTTPAPERSGRTTPGFFDPGFGFGDGSVLGTRVVMEVRAREVPFLVYHGQTFFKVWFERLCGRTRAGVRPGACLVLPASGADA